MKLRFLFPSSFFNMIRNALCVGVCVLLFLSEAHANQTWTGATDLDWNTATNWNGAAVPLATDRVTISSSAGEVLIDAPGAVSKDVYMGTSSLRISGGGTLTSSLHVLLGAWSDTSSVATVSGAGSSWSAAGYNFYIGSSSAGTLRVEDGATVTGKQTHIGSSVGGDGLLVVTGNGSLFNGTSLAYVGNLSDGAVTVEDGGEFRSILALVGNGASSTGTVHITGTGSVWNVSNWLAVGQSGAATILVENGGTINNTAGTLAALVGSTATVTVTGSGSSWVNSTGLTIGDAGNASLIIADQAVVSSPASVTISNAAGSVSSLVIGSASGNAPVAPGNLSAPSVSLANSTASIIFNHTSSNYDFTPDITGSGTIVALKGTSILSGDLSAFTGTTEVSSDAVLNMQGDYGGDLTVSDGGEAVLNTTIGGDVTVENNGLLNATATIDGSVMVNTGGTFSANSYVGGDVDVNNTATLKGTGTVGGNVIVYSGGKVAPGNSIGTLNVTGDVTFNSGSIYDVEVDAAGNSDLILATGAANISGGTINLLPDETSGTFAASTQYTIITASGGVSGTFDGISVNTTSPFFAGALASDATNVYATLVRTNASFTTVANAANQYEVALAMDSLTNANAAHAAVEAQATDANTRVALSALTGELHADLKGSILQDDASFASLLTDRMRLPLLQSGEDYWMEAYGGWSEKDGRNTNTFTFDTKTKGVAFGYDQPFSGLDETTVGFALSYGHTTASLGTSSTSSLDGSVDHYRAAVYGVTRVDDFVLRTSGQYGFHQISSDRAVRFAGYNKRHEADYHAHSLVGQAELSYKANFGQATEVEPFVNAQYGGAALSSFVESGGAGALRTDNDVFSDGVLGAGLFLQHTVGKGLVSVESCSTLAGFFECPRLKARVAWKHSIGKTSPKSYYSMDGSPYFSSTGAAAARNSVEVGLSTDFVVKENLVFGVGYVGQYASQASSNVVRASLNFKF